MNSRGPLLDFDDSADGIAHFSRIFGSWTGQAQSLPQRETARTVDIPAVLVHLGQKCATGPRRATRLAEMTSVSLTRTGVAKCDYS